MKKFSLSHYQRSFVLYQIVVFFLHIIASIVDIFVLGGSNVTAVVLYMLYFLYPSGFWNFFFYLFNLPPNQFSNSKVFLVSIFALPGTLFTVFVLPSATVSFSNLTSNLLPTWLGFIVSNFIFYVLAFGIVDFRHRKRIEREK